MTRLAHLAAAVLVVGTSTAALTAVSPATASDDDRVIRTGSCSEGARWKMKAKEDDGRIEVEGEIDSSRVGQRWTWVLRHDGTVSARGVSRTTARSGSFEVERKTVDARGADQFVLRATHAGQTCVARVRY